MFLPWTQRMLSHPIKSDMGHNLQFLQLVASKMFVHAPTCRVISQWLCACKADCMVLPWRGCLGRNWGHLQTRELLKMWMRHKPLVRICLQYTQVQVLQLCPLHCALIPLLLGCVLHAHCAMGNGSEWKCVSSTLAGYDNITPSAEQVAQANTSITNCKKMLCYMQTKTVQQRITSVRI